MMNPAPEPIVNIATVKHRSPFRYPGGKTWLVPRIRQWLNSIHPARRTTFIEPFAGGAIVGLTVAFEQLADYVLLVELDAQVAAVWQTIIGTDAGEWLAQQIRDFDLNAETLHGLLKKSSAECSIAEIALQTIVKNRVNRGGILAAGAGRLKQGENGRGIASRWYPQTLCNRILDIVAIRDRFEFIHGDGLTLLAQTAHRSDAVYFIDPPYTAAGKQPGRRLYTHAQIDHKRLFEQVAHLKGDFLMTYHNVAVVHTLAAQHQFEIHPIAMKNTHHAKQTELLIGRNLAWLKD